MSMDFGGPTGNMPSVMGHNFSRVPSAQIPRSSFDRSHGHKTTCGAGRLIPIFVDPVLPGDTFNLTASIFARLLTPVVPVMDNIYCETFFFFVPNRLVWDHWEEFNGQQVNPGDSTDYLIPQWTPAGPTAATTVATASIADYFGIPSNIAFGSAGAYPPISALPFRAYYLIWNEWFRDQNLQDSVVIPLGDGPDVNGDYTGPTGSNNGGCMYRGRRHDYFTSSLPWPQKGPSITIPLGTEAPIVSNLAGTSGRFDMVGYGQTSGANGGISTTTGGAMKFGSAVETTVEWPLSTDAYYNYADLTTATAATINELRQSFQIQKLYERDARGGTRYTEIIRSHFGVISPDARLQRPEYLGGGRSPVTISPIPQTSSTDSTSPQGNLAAIGVMASTKNGFVKSFTEHGYVIGLMNFLTDITYQQGIERHWSYQTRFDHYWPALSHIGEQAVLQQEIYATGVVADDQGVWGYQERYAEYRYKPSRVSSLMRGYPAVTNNLGIWNLSVPFTSAPSLSDSYIVDSNSPNALNKIIAVPDSSEQFLVDIYFKYICARPMPTYSVPGLIDHF